jgi:hypothetical protein
MKLYHNFLLHIKSKAVLILIVICIFSCSKDDDNKQPSPETPIATISKISDIGDFNFKTYYQEVANANNRKGIIILAHGDGGSENDAVLNDQCKSLAEQGYVAATTSYRNPNQALYTTNVNNFKADIESVINKLAIDYSIPINKVIVGGSSRGGDLLFPMFLPTNTILGVQISPTTLDVKGAILQCSGGDEYKGRFIKKQVAYMANKNDNVFQTDATFFQTGLTNNPDNVVKTLSECLIVNSTGHCTNPELYKPFIIKKVKEWLP